MSVYLRIRHRFGPRLSEWAIATVITLWGVVLLLPADTMEGPSWVVFRELLPEHVWGALMISLGLLRLGGLIVNGARRTITPWIRMVSACVGVVLFIGISAGFGLSGVIGTWIAVYPTFVVVELFNIHRAAHDVGGGDAAATARTT